MAERARGDQQTRRRAGDIERNVAAFAAAPNGGLIVAGGSTGIHRDVFIRLAAQYRLPAVYPFRYYANSGGLISYGPDTVDQFRVWPDM